VLGPGASGFPEKSNAEDAVRADLQLKNGLYRKCGSLNFKLQITNLKYLRVLGVRLFPRGSQGAK
jgi:hypothetical protein